MCVLSFSPTYLLAQGIVAYSDLFLEEKELIKTVKEQGLVLLTWGEKNNISENIALQKKLGVDGIIYDGCVCTCVMKSSMMGENVTIEWVCPC